MVTRAVFFNGAAVLLEMSFELYRRSTLGQTLTDSLDELIQSEQITPQLAMRVLAQFDRSMTESLALRVRSRAVFEVSIS